MPLVRNIVLGIACFALVFVPTIMAVRKKQPAAQQPGKKRRRRKKRPSPQDLIKRLGTMNLILVVIGLALLWFTFEMIQLFKVFGAIPDTLCTCVFGALGGECGAMAWIKTTKERQRERKWELEDRGIADEEHKNAAG